jgi:3D (Asp-Asp-Asp) domain-containing protein
MSNARLKTARILLIAFGLTILPISAKDPQIRHKRETPMKATAYSTKGTTKSGAQTKRGVIAADPKVLPLGTKVKVTGAGPYSGHYEVKDTGKKIKGKKVDVFIPSNREAKKFGVKDVKVKVVKPAPKQ